jgi:hypothetical protein
MCTKMAVCARVLSLVALVGGLVCFVPLRATALPPIPSVGTATVDGQCDEWNLTSDFFANMYLAGDPCKTVESKIYLRYDGASNSLYMLMLAQSHVIGCCEGGGGVAGTVLGAVGSKTVGEPSGNARFLPCSMWVGRAFDGDSTHAIGYEAAFHIMPGTYILLAHIDVLDGGRRTLATTGFPGNGPILLIPEPSASTEPASWGAIKALYR